MQRTTYWGEDNLKKVNQALTDEGIGPGNVDEYLAQDFWVYVGASKGQDLFYLGPLLEIGGARRSGIDDALETFHGQSLSEFYWGWVKNQTIENQWDVGPGPGVYCELSEEALSSGTPVRFPSIEQVFPFDTQSAFDRLPPLTGKVIEIDFGDRSGLAIVHIAYEECVGLLDPIAREACVLSAQQRLASKIYVEGESSCQDFRLPGVEGEGTRHLTELSPDKRYFVVVANLHPRDEQGYYIAIE
jgi:hypothetical protein